MKRLLTVLLLVLVALPTLAAVKKEEKTRVQFGGVLGRMVNLFGGKAAREGVTATAAVKGNRKRTVTGDTGQIIDLDEEKIYDLDMKGKSYRVTTFEEMRRRMQEAMEKARQQAASAPTAPPQPQEGKEMQVDFNIKESGQRKTISGYDCREVVLTVSVYEKGKTLEESGGMVMTGNIWLAPRIAAMKEMEEFDLRYAQKLGEMFASAMTPEQMGALMASYPYMMQAMSKFNAESVNMDGTSVLTTMTMEGVQSREQAAQQAQQQQPAEQESRSGGIPSVGGILGGLGRRAVRRRTDEQQPADAAATPGRSTLMTMTDELVKVSTDVPDTDVAIPTGFRLRN
ncbi:MAG: hypothetical protein HW398_187 [Acidobacteria bacterium]|nr:hypothetical protein [Acidobacteriota bacterium]